MLKSLKKKFVKQFIVLNSTVLKRLVSQIQKICVTKFKNICWKILVLKNYPRKIGIRYFWTVPKYLLHMSVFNQRYGNELEKKNSEDDK